jgi:hypothetical protein
MVVSTGTKGGRGPTMFPTGFLTKINLRKEVKFHIVIIKIMLTNLFFCAYSRMISKNNLNKQLMLYFWLPPSHHLSKNPAFSHEGAVCCIKVKTGSFQTIVKKV